MGPEMKRNWKASIFRVRLLVVISVCWGLVRAGWLTVYQEIMTTSHHGKMIFNFCHDFSGRVSDEPFILPVTRVLTGCHPDLVSIRQARSAQPLRELSPFFQNQPGNGVEKTFNAPQKIAIDIDPMSSIDSDLSLRRDLKLDLIKLKEKLEDVTKAEEVMSHQLQVMKTPVKSKKSLQLKEALKKEETLLKELRDKEQDQSRTKHPKTLVQQRVWQVLLLFLCFLPKKGLWGQYPKRYTGDRVFSQLNELARSCKWFWSIFFSFQKDFLESGKKKISPAGLILAYLSLHQREFRNDWPLEHDDWKITFLFKWSLFRGYVKVRRV